MSFLTDLDECADPNSNNCSVAENQECINTIGSFMCQCKAGYSTQSGGQCKGILSFLTVVYMQVRVGIKNYYNNNYYDEQISMNV